MPENPAILTGELTGTGSVGPFQYRKKGSKKRSGGNLIQLVVTGVGTATLAVHICEVDQAVADGAISGSSETTDFERVLEPAGDCDIYVNCSAYTSGTIAVKFTH